MYEESYMVWLYERPRISAYYTLGTDVYYVHKMKRIKYI